MKENSLSFQEVVDRTKALIRDFEKVEKRPWGVEGAMIELQKQVGELSKQVMTFEGYYIPYRDTQPEYQTCELPRVSPFGLNPWRHRGVLAHIME